MALFRSGNPALGAKTFEVADKSDQVMTLQGTVNKTFILFGLILLGAILPWRWAMSLATASPLEIEAIESKVFIALIGGALGGFVVAMITIFFKKISPYTAPVYALLEGFSLGAISGIYELHFTTTQNHGIVFQAVALTLGVLFCLLGAYKSGLIKATENFKLGMAAAMGSLMLYLVFSSLFRFTGISSGVPLLWQTGPIGIIASVVVIVLAALNLVLDFDFIESGVERGAPKYMEWYGAFGLVVTLVWLYLEILRLLAKLNRR
jgi:uncharacterized YccA/Bax inhibitor family protein